MFQTLIVPAGTARAEHALAFEPTAGSDPTVYDRPHNVNLAQEMHRERLRQADAQRLRRAALRARRSLVSRLLGV